MSLAEEKAAARTAAFARRRGAHGVVDPAPAQAALRDVLREAGAGVALSGYLPIRTEIDPVPVMADWAGPVGVPVIEGAGLPLTFHRWRPGCALIDGPFGACVPAEAEEVVPRVLIVPLVAFDDDGGRLGYGGGFYDRTLERLKARGPVLAVGFAYEAQRAEALPREATDQRLDAVVTEAGVRRWGGLGP
ncbi:5-formyltetrahydrofolate cyclo-ligase [Ovoidimarina sediminis]|uniref:5-formyltetrahydrofolate cyclo-ligase n=1 Tax=Ovoidimarina sediminis TaxID=3079856 RepID=UPI0029148C4E|nr:5-formyltetrahydrofolate cyclo-ligase [Rhodophyticola sp. MJ-SS7]MDU8942298.1 5-formyltetrahydrofolate cyclo-ligase [Rhodophyticola sp. MJ-SS7]